MNTDVALSFKAKLTNVEGKIEEIERIGFNVDALKEELEKIISDTNAKVKVSKKNTFSGFIIADYSNAIGRLEKLDNILESYEIYLKVNNYAEYLDKNYILEGRISDVVKEIISLLKKLGNSSVIDYEEEKKIVEPFYNGVFKVICMETYYIGRSNLLDFCNLNDVDKSFIEKQIKDCLKEIDFKKYPEIEAKYYEIKRIGSDSSLLDIDFIKLLVFKDEKEKLKDTVADTTKKKVKTIKTLEGQIAAEVKDLDESTRLADSCLEHFKEQLGKLSKSVVAFAITLSLPVGTYFGSLFIFNKLFKDYSYDVKSETYSSYDNSVIDSTERNILADEDLDNKAYVIKYDVKDQDANEFYRDKSVYDLSFIKPESLEQVIDYWKNKPDVPASTEETINIKDKQDIVKEKVDYYEVVYKIVDLESKQIAEPTFEKKFFAVVFAIIIGTIELGVACTREDNIRENVKCLKWSFQKYKIYKKDVLTQTRKLLDLIGKNDALRKEFNIEMSKHKNLFIEAGLVLPEEVISEEEKAKLLRKGNIRK